MPGNDQIVTVIHPKTVTLSEFQCENAACFTIQVHVNTTKLLSSNDNLEFTAFINEQSEYESVTSIKVSHDVHADLEQNQLLDDQMTS